jgi:Zn-finger nucleic acid-binding protein
MACGNKILELEEEIVKTDLDCPQCNHPNLRKSEKTIFLEARSFEIDVEEQRLKLFIYYCPQCDGCWIKPKILRAMIESAQKYRKETINKPRYRKLEERPYFICPEKTCGEMLGRISWDAYLEDFDYQSTLPVIDSCRLGHGIWLDQEELEWLLESRGTKSVITKNEKDALARASSGYYTTAPYNELDKITIPIIEAAINIASIGDI